MAYSNVTPPTLPEYDAAANPYYLIQFEYAIGAEDWETVRFWYGAAPLTWNGEAVTNSADCYCQTYGTGSPEWTAWGVMAAAGEMALAPGVTTADTYMRLYTNHDILDGTGAVWLAKGTVTPTEEDKEAEIQIRIKSKLAGIIAAWCAPVRQFPNPTAEPVAFLYNGVRLPGLPESDWPYKAMLTSTDSYIEDFGKAISAVLVISTMPLAYKEAVFGGGLIATEAGETVCYRISTKGGVTDENWKLDADNSGEFKAGEVVAAPGIDILRWANHKILNYEDGTVLLEASEPVPVYE